ncbi:MAG: hypothetical protein AMJ81_10650 [Phycisphaerae bacterium SM23_33]|nr:MAG: hypothetical protein AMJ81_10650 [Phycisphaerae bacterium SM23_33]
MEQWHCIVGGQQYGPVTLEVLQAWAAEGRLTPTDYVWTEGMETWSEARSVAGLFAGPAGAPATVFVRPHRGAVVLTLGILGIVPCFICGIVAWVLGNTDLREMRAGRMDPAGEGMTRAGKICGIVGVCVAIGFVALYALWFGMIMLMAFRVRGGGGGP